MRASLIAMTGIFMLLFNASPAQAEYVIDCASVELGAPPHLVYDPTAHVDMVTELKVYPKRPPEASNSNIYEVCEEAGAMKMFFWDELGHGRPNIGGLAYEIISPDGTNVAYAGALPTQPHQFYHLKTHSGHASPVTFYLVIAAGQQVGPGRHSSPLALRREDRRMICQEREVENEHGHSRVEYEHCRPAPKRYVQDVRNFSVRVNHSVSINIAGAGTAKTIDFGILTTGARRSVNIQARSTSPFHISFSSKMNGVLKYGGHKRSPWKVDYSATLGGQPIAEDKDFVSENDTQGLKISLPFTVTIGDTTNKRAGPYSDIITLEIKAVL